MKHSRIKTLWILFRTMLGISAFTFGGGFVIVTLMRKKLVDELGWLEETEMLDMTALAQSAPGAIAVNAAVLVGWKVAGFPGMAAAVLGTILPPFVILGVISVFYDMFAQNRYVALALKGMACGVAAVILDVSADLGGKVIKTKNAPRILVMSAAFIAAFVFDVNAVVIVLCALVIGLILAWTGWKRGAEK